jgi:SAM-dependent methyltransferase
MDKHPDWWVGASLTSIPVLDEAWRALYDAHIPRVATGTLSAVEIGCYPGGFIAELGKLGYKISGFDTHPEVGQLNSLFEAVPLVDKAGFYCESLEQHLKRGAQYDLVMSMGFIEHFDDWASIFKKHSELCKVGGKIIIGAPNFSSPVQRALHSVLDHINIENHCLHSMYPLAWEGYMRALGLSVIYSGHYGGFNFWTETQPAVSTEALLSNLTKALIPHVRELSEIFNAKESGYSIIVVEKNREILARSDLHQVDEYFVRLSRKLSEDDSVKSKRYIESFRYLVD